VRLLGLIDSTGTTVFVPIDWTDRNPPSPQSATEGSKQILNAHCLLNIVRWIEKTQQRRKEKGD